jgi:hypothetical protein
MISDKVRGVDKHCWTCLSIPQGSWADLCRTEPTATFSTICEVGGRYGIYCSHPLAPAHKSWIHRSFPIDRFSHVVRFSVDDRLLAVGGGNGMVYVCVFHDRCHSSNNWNLFSRLLTPSPKLWDLHCMATPLLYNLLPSPLMMSLYFPDHKMLRFDLGIPMMELWKPPCPSISMVLSPSEN